MGPGSNNNPNANYAYPDNRPGGGMVGMNNGMGGPGMGGPGMGGPGMGGPSMGPNMGGMQMQN